MIKEDTSLPGPHHDDVRGAATLRVGIVGSGFMGAVHARAARSAGAVVVGVAASSPERAALAREAVGAERGFGSVDELLDADVEVLHVCVPNNLHSAVTRAALERGVHVICEKPLTTTLADAEDLRDECDARGLIGAIPFVYRFHPMVREIRSRLAAGDAGRVALVSGGYLQDWLAASADTNWRVDPSQGGDSRTFADIGSHWFDLLEFVLGSRVARLSAQFSTLFATRSATGGDAEPVRTEDTVTVQFAMEDGVLGSFSASQVARGRKNRLAIEISGERRSFFFDQENPEVVWQGDEAGSRMLVRDPHTLSADAARLAILPAGHAQGYQDCFNAFVADTYSAIRGDRPEGLPDFGDGVRSAQLTEAVVQSARDQGDWVEVPVRELVR